MKKITIILLTSLICIIIFGLVSFRVFAADENFKLDKFDGDVAAAAGMEKLVDDTAITAISIMRVVCVTIAIVTLLTISMKYMMSAPGDRADIKKHAVHYVIGAFILFGVTGILSIINNFALQI